MSPMPDNFLTRYNTTENSCECLDKRWMPINYKCKHNKVFKDPSVWRSWMEPCASTWKKLHPHSPFNNRAAWRKALDFSTDDIIDWLKEKRWPNAGRIHGIYTFHVDLYKKHLNPKKYNTTLTSCDCLDMKWAPINHSRNPDYKCKHIKAFIEQHPPKVELQFLKTNEFSLVSSIEEFNKQLALLKEEQAAFEKEKEEYTDALGLCMLCYTNKKIDCCDTCNKGMCTDCWNNMELRRKTNCPWCRTPMKSLTDVLINKFKEFST